MPFRAPKSLISAKKQLSRFFAPFFKNLPYFQPVSRRPTTPQPTSLPTDQRTPLALATHEIRHR